MDRLKADFTAHVSHELRTPLTAIREGTALLLEGISGPLTKSQREILEVVRNHSQRLFQSISSILDLSKMEAEMMDYDFTMCDLRGLIEKSVEAVELIARKGDIKLRWDIAGSIPMLLADERRIQQVLDNLFSNALRFSPVGGEVRVEAVPVGSNRRQAAAVEIMVSDDGPGIPAGEVQNIFKHFYQSRNQKSNGHQGTGLGLAIARHIVEAHKGRIWAESEIGCGSTFHVVLPIRTDTGFQCAEFDTYQSEPAMDSKSKVLLGSAVFFIFVLIVGCTTSQIQSARNSAAAILVSSSDGNANRRLCRLFQGKFRSAQILPGHG